MITRTRPMGWGDNLDSGPGSDPSRCLPYIRFLEQYVAAAGIRTVLDLGCGDGRLARATSWGRARYTGLDFPWDIRECALPPAELVIVKDVLQHWPTADIVSFRKRLAPYQHVLITNCADDFRTNTEIAFGGCRALDLSADPFCWPVTEVFRWRGDETKAVVKL